MVAGAPIYTCISTTNEDEPTNTTTTRPREQNSRLFQFFSVFFFRIPEREKTDEGEAEQRKERAQGLLARMRARHARRSDYFASPPPPQRALPATPPHALYLPLYPRTIATDSETGPADKPGPAPPPQSSRRIG